MLADVLEMTDDEIDAVRTSSLWPRCLAAAAATARAAAAIPNARVHVLDGHGHFAHTTEPDMVTDLVRRFVAQ